jgi:hypothetical protein
MGERQVPIPSAGTNILSCAFLPCPLRLSGFEELLLTALLSWVGEDWMPFCKECSRKEHQVPFHALFVPCIPSSYSWHNPDLFPSLFIIGIICTCVCSGWIVGCFLDDLLHFGQSEQCRELWGRGVSELAGCGALISWVCLVRTLHVLKSHLKCLESVSVDFLFVLDFI